MCEKNKVKIFLDEILQLQVFKTLNFIKPYTNFYTSLQLFRVLRSFLTEDIDNNTLYTSKSHKRNVPFKFRVSSFVTSAARWRATKDIFFYIYYIHRYVGINDIVSGVGLHSHPTLTKRRTLSSLYVPILIFLLIFGRYQSSLFHRLTMRDKSIWRLITIIKHLIVNV